MIEVLRAKHPESWVTTAANLDSYPDQPPDLVPVDITDNTVMAVAEKSQAGPGRAG